MQNISIDSGLITALQLRVISISKDSTDEFRGYLAEIGLLVDGKKSKQYYKQIKIEQKSGFEEFRKKVDSLNLFDLPNGFELVQLPLHQPFSSYTIESKKS